jgi:hypothetical protein
VIAGSRRVQSAFIATTPFFFIAAQTASLFSTIFSLTMQVTHQAAVKFTNTGRPSCRAAASLAGSNGVQRSSALAVSRAGAPRSAQATNAPAPASASTANAAAIRRPRGAALRAVLHAQSPNAIRIAPASAANSAPSPAWRLSTQASQAAVAYIGNARNWRKRSIHAPGFGRRRSSAGL